MVLYAEAMMLLLPPELGGRSAPVAPRDGSCRLFAVAGGQTLRLRLIEGPPLLMPGEGARVMLEVESESMAVPHCDLALYETEGRVVGSLTVSRLWGERVSA